MEGRSFYYFITEFFPGWKSTERSEIRWPIETNKTYSQAWFVSTSSQYFKFQTTGGRRAGGSLVTHQEKQTLGGNVVREKGNRSHQSQPRGYWGSWTVTCIIAYGEDLVRLYNYKFPNGLSGTWSKEKTQNFQDRETCPMVPNLLSTPVSTHPHFCHTPATLRTAIPDMTSSCGSTPSKGLLSSVHLPTSHPT